MTIDTDAIRARANAATFTVNDDNGVFFTTYLPDATDTPEYWGRDLGCGCVLAANDAPFLSRARADVLAMADEIDRLRGTIATSPDGQEWSLTLTAPSDTYAFMPVPGRLKVTALLPGEGDGMDTYEHYLLARIRAAATNAEARDWHDELLVHRRRKAQEAGESARIGDAIRDAAAGVGYEAVSLADAGIRSIADVFGRIAVDAAGAKNRDYGDECTESAPSWEELAARGQRANKRLIDENRRLRFALAFAAAQIKAGLPWTPECEERIGALLKGRAE